MKSITQKISFIINKNYKKKFFFLIPLLFIGMLLEILGLGALIPILSLIADPDIINQSQIIANTPIIKELTYNYLVLTLLLIIGTFYLVKNLFLSFLTYHQNWLLSKLLATVSKELFKKYLHQSYNFHTTVNSSEIIKILQTEISLFRTYTTALISLIVELGLLISVLFTLVFIEPTGALSVGLFLAISSYLFYVLSKSKLTFWGNSREKIDQELSKSIVESLGGIKTIKLLNSESVFTRNFDEIQNSKSDILTKANTLAQLPRYYLELISVLGLVLFIITMLYQNSDITSLIATIGVFVAATFRILPSINKILTAFQNLKYNNSSVNIIYNELRKLKHLNNEPIHKQKITLNDKIEIQNLDFSYKSNLSLILDNVNLEIKAGETIGIIGQSGQGKSTFIDIINGLFAPNKGNILSDGININKNLYSWREIIGYVPQDIFLLDDSIENNILFGRPKNKIALKKAIQKSQLHEFINDLPNELNTRVGERGVKLSGGQKQRIAIARAFYNNPEFLIFDEATSALDTKTEQKIMDFIYSFKKKKTILIVAHRLSTLSNCDKVYKIDNGKLKLT